MDIRDYVRMLKRGWPVVLLGAVAFAVLASVYLALTPKQYEATAVLLVSTKDPGNVTDLQLGAQFSVNAVATYAQIIDSTTVLGPVATAMRPQMKPDDLVSMVSTATAQGSFLISVTATGHDPALVANIANAAAASAGRIIPTLEGVSGGQPLVALQTIRPAVERDQAVSPNAKRILVIGFFIGAVVGLAVAIALQALDTRIRRVHDLQVLTDVPLLGVVPRVRRAAHNGVVVRDDSTGVAGEAFRTLRTNVRFLDSGIRRSLVIAAVADQSDGAHVPANLAWMLAEAGRRVLLVDLDLRRSTVGDTVGISGGSGMTDVLAGPARLTDVIRETGHPNLQVVISGVTPPNPSELLSIPKMGSLVAWMESHYDHVILHAPPILAYSDAAVIAGVGGASPRQPAAPGTLITVTTGRTRAQDLDTALTVLANVGVSPLGLVLTRAGKSILERRKGGGGLTRRGSRRGGTMSRRFDWEWRNGKTRPPDMRAANEAGISGADIQ